MPAQPPLDGPAPRPERVLRGVLSDQDIEREIADSRLIFTSDDNEDLSEGIKGSAYDFRVGRLISRRSGVVEAPESVSLQPGEMVTLLSKEWVNIPSYITGLVIPRNKQAKRGILILNAGHVDPTWRGQIMAQVVNLADQDRAVQLGSYDGAVFSIVFSYLESPSTKSRDPQKSENERVLEERAAVLEQAETLVLAEEVMRQKFVPRDEFTSMLWINLVGLFLILGLIVGVWAGLTTITDSTITTDWNWSAFGPVVLATFLGVFLGFGVFEAVKKQRARVRRWLKG